ncbi:MAG: hypothetical protein ABI415_05210 [Flavitalea sp.]
MKKIINIFLILATFVMSAGAQTDLYNSGILLTTGSSDTVYVSGGFTNASTSTLTNNGNLYVAQTLSNAQSAMAIGSGTLYLNGTSQQTVAGAQQFRTNNLITSNAGGVLLNNNLDVSGVHTFSNGIISSSATPNYLVYEAGSSYTGDGDGDHVSGWVKKFGTTDFVFPVGNGTVERTVQLTNLSLSSEFNVHHYVTTTNTANLQSPLVSVDRFEYWQINKISGGSANVAMNWDNSKITFPQYPLASIRAAYYTGGFWTDQGAGATGNVTTTGNITSNTLSTFGPLTFGSISAVLPLTFLGTYAYREPTGVLVEWKTTNEKNVDHFEVERSTDGRTFVKVGTVASSSTPGIGDYTFSDLTSSTGKIYYRIRSIDIDGKFMFSKVVTITDGNEGEEIMVANPAKNHIKLTVSQFAKGKYNYQLRTDGGQTAQTGILNIISSGSYTIDLNNIRPGIYILTLNKDGFIQNHKIRVL